MPVSATDQYTTQEDAAVSTPHSYVAILRETASSLISDDGGTHDGTEKSGTTIVVSAGNDTGTWISPVYESGMLTPFVIYDLIEWTETLNGGSVSVYIRSDIDRNAVAEGSWVEVTNGSIRHTLGYRYYQIKITLSGSAVIESLSVRYKGVVPPEEYSSISEIRSGPDIDLHRIQSGTCRVSFDNRQGQWEKRNVASYIYDKKVFGNILEVWIGFEDPSIGFDASESDFTVLSSDYEGTVLDSIGDDSDYSVTSIGFDYSWGDITVGSPICTNEYNYFDIVEWNLVYLGEVEDLVTVSGIGVSIDAEIQAYDYLHSKLQTTKIGTPSAAGLPQPYIQGRRYRNPVQEIETHATWRSETAYSVGDHVIPTSSNATDYFYVCTTAGTSDSTEPTWNETVGGSTSEGGGSSLVWTNGGLKRFVYEIYGGPFDSLNDLLNRGSDTNKYESLNPDEHPYDIDYRTYEEDAYYFVGDRVGPTSPNDYYYEATTEGWTSGTEPTWPTTLGDTVTDGEVTWECVAETSDADNDEGIFKHRMTSGLTADVTKSTTTHPVDIIKDIIENECGVTSTYIDSDSFTTAKAVNSSIEVSCHFEEQTAARAIEALLRACDAALYIEGGQLVISAYTTDLPTTGDSVREFTMSGETVHLHNVASVQGRDWIINKLTTYYGNYAEDKTSVIVTTDSTSISDYGTREQEYSFKYTDEVSFATSTQLSSIASQIVTRLANLTEQLELSGDFAMLRSQSFDILKLSDGLKGLYEENVLVLEKVFNVLEHRGSLTGILYDGS